MVNRHVFSVNKFSVCLVALICNESAETENCFFFIFSTNLNEILQISLLFSDDEMNFLVNNVVPQSFSFMVFKWPTWLLEHLPGVPE